MSALHLLTWVIFAQGVFLAAASLSKWRHRSNRYLGVFLVLLSLHGLVALAWIGPAAISAPELIIVFTSFPFLYGPLVYRYVWHSLFRSVKEPIPFRVHAIPAIANLALYLFFYLVAGREAFVGVTQDVFFGSAPVFVLVVEWAKVVSGLMYTALIVRLLFRNLDGLRRWAAHRERRRWLKALIGGFTANWIIVLISMFILWGGGLSDRFQIATTGVQLVAFLAFLYIVTFFALRYPAVLDPKEAREAIRQKLNLPPGFVEETLRRLDRIAERREFTDPELTLNSLAERVGVHPNVLSFIVNDELGVGFREYLNGLRLEEFLRLARTAAGEHSLLNLALDAGFASKSTFLRAFRTRFGMKPSEYLATES